MTVRVAAFARLREIVGGGEPERALPDGATVDDLWQLLAAEHPALRELRASTRFVRGGAFVGAETPLRDGDEVALLPPFGGG